MKNATYTVTLTREELLAIRKALIHARFAANDGGGIYMATRDKLITLMAQQDRENQ